MVSPRIHKSASIGINCQGRDAVQQGSVHLAVQSAVVQRCCAGCRAGCCPGAVAKFGKGGALQGAVQGQRCCAGCCLTCCRKKFICSFSILGLCWCNFQALERVLCRVGGEVWQWCCGGCCGGCCPASFAGCRPGREFHYFRDQFTRHKKVALKPFSIWGLCRCNSFLAMCVAKFLHHDP